MRVILFKMSLSSNRCNPYCCVVPECGNTRVKTPGKLWIQVPTEPSLRKTWFQLAKRDPQSLSAKTRVYFCGDHFDLENDMENYTRYKIMGSVKKIKMKPGSVPSKFDCQTDIKRLEERTTCCACRNSIPASAQLYRCVQCAGRALLCTRCMARTHAHRNHCLMRLPSTRIHRVLEGVFQKLQLDVNKLLGQEDELKLEEWDEPQDEPEMQECSQVDTLHTFIKVEPLTAKESLEPDSLQQDSDDTLFAPSPKTREPQLKRRKTKVTPTKRKRKESEKPNTSVRARKRPAIKRELPVDSSEQSGDASGQSGDASVLSGDASAQCNSVTVKIKHEPFAQDEIDCNVQTFEVFIKQERLEVGD